MWRCIESLEPNADILTCRAMNRRIGESFNLLGEQSLTTRIRRLWMYWVGEWEVLFLFVYFSRYYCIFFSFTICLVQSSKIPVLCLFIFFSSILPHHCFIPMHCICLFFSYHCVFTSADFLPTFFGCIRFPYYSLIFVPRVAQPSNYFRSPSCSLISSKGADYSFIVRVLNNAFF